MPETSTLGFALIGCGAVGAKRAAALARIPLVSLRAACDLDLSRAERLVHGIPGAHATADVNAVLGDRDTHAVIVATLNASLAPLAYAAIRAGKHVLVEKPGALNSTQLQHLANAAREHGVCVRIGYNHRFHPALQKARQLIDAGTLGPLMFLRARYGHGGRIGYDREWRADPSQSGGGELIDQGVHLIDLSSWILGDFTSVDGHATTSFWDMKVDDNAFLSLRTSSGETAWLHVSCTEWKNLFSLEVYGRHAKLQIDGLGGSYGTEKLTLYRMLPEMGPPETSAWEFPRGDESWQCELEAFVSDIRERRDPSPGLREGMRILQIVETIYARSGYPVNQAGL